MRLSIARQVLSEPRIWFNALISLAIAGLLVACAGSAVRNPVPDTLLNQATATGMNGVRFWGDETPSNINAIIKEKFAQMKASRPQLLKAGKKAQVHFLTVSGGGSDGAFGAGLLVGWSASGTRPEFELVTGVSTGALIAPFAYLGKQYDPILKEMYTTYSTDAFLRKRPVKGLLGGSALASNKPLAGLIAKYVDQKFMAEIAAAHMTGRRLLIGTTNLDAQRPVTWDMGKIASSGNPEAIHLFRNVLLASAAIPGVFPPVFINVQADGKTYDEMHVDGGTTNQVFLLPNQLMVANDVERKTRFRPRRRVYVIRNGRVGPEHKVVRARTLSIASRSVSTMIKYQGIGDLYKMYAFSKRNGIQYRLATIPTDFKNTSTETFDTVYMTKLYNLGYKLGKQGYRWQKKPPGSGGR
jgi:predicted patatin/cPLA2 family phospholipase